MDMLWCDNHLDFCMYTKPQQLPLIVHFPQFYKYIKCIKM